MYLMCEGRGLFLVLLRSTEFWDYLHRLFATLKDEGYQQIGLRVKKNGMVCSMG